MVDGKLTTTEAAGRVGIHLATLQRWIATGRIEAPRPTLVGAVGYRLWSSKDVEMLRKVKQQTYRKGRGQTKGNRSKA